MKWSQRYLPKMLASLIVLIVVILLSFSAIMIYKTQLTIKANAYGEMDDACRALKSQVELQLRSVSNGMQLLAGSRAVTSLDEKEVDNLSQMMIKSMPVVTQIYVMDKSGMQIYKSSYANTMGDRSDRDYFKGAIAGKPTLSDTITSRSTKESIVVYACPIYRNGKIDGVIGCSINLKFLSTIVSSLYAEKESYGFVVDSKGQLLAHPNPEYVHQMLNLSYLEPVKQAMTGHKGKGEYVFNKSKRMTVFYPMPEVKWSVFVQRPHATVFNQSTSMELFLLITTICITFVSVIAIIRISLKLDNPIQKIVAYIEMIKSNQKLPLSCSIRDDEFGVIENALISMSLEISLSHDELENRVSNRTNELNHALVELQNAQEKIIRTEKMNALGRMVAGVAHAMNTPIGNALTSSTYSEKIVEELNDKMNQGDLTKSYLKDFIEDNREAVRIINAQLKNASSLVSSIKEITSFDNDIDRDERMALIECLTLAKPELEKMMYGTGHHLSVKVPQNAIIMICPDALNLLIKILIDNAMEHGFNGIPNGHIDIEVDVTKEKTMLYVRNNGASINEEVIARIFEPFYKANMGSKGRGLGLSIAYVLVETYLKGKITCSNLLPIGVEFAIEILEASS